MARRALISLSIALAALGILSLRPTVLRGETLEEARDRLLGIGWDQPGQVRLRWFGVTNFIASFGGQVVLLDGWVIEGSVSGYVPISVADLIAVDPEYIYIGHSHFDHAAHVGSIAEATGAKVVGTTEHCGVVKRDATDPSAVSCVSILGDGGGPFSAAATPFGATGAPAEGPAGLGVTVVMSKHSAGRAPDPAAPRAPAGPPPDPTAIVEHPATPADFAHFGRRAADAEGGALAYLFTLGELSILWHDSSGPISNPGEAGAAEIEGALAALPDPDIQFGAIMGFNQLTNGLKDPREYIEAARPKVFVPTHHDNWAPPITTEGRNYYSMLVGELENISEAQRPELCFITDPENYQAPFVLTASQWAGAIVPAIEGCYTPE